MIVYFGGSFNPIHIGHLVLAEELYHLYNPKYVLFIPTSISPFKQEPPVSGEHRIAMIKKSIRHDNRFVVTATEIRNEGKVSYTVDTLKKVLEERDPEVILALGSDEVTEFQKWKNWEEVVFLCKEVIFVGRNGYINHLPDYLKGYNNIKFNNSFLSLSISSSDIRRRIKEELPYKYLIHPDVFTYIEKYGLYKGV